MLFRFRRLALMLPLVAAVALSACHDRESDRSDTENDVVESVVPENTVPVVPPVRDVPADNAAVAPKPVAPPQISEDQQVLDDAAAVGMTARRSGANSAGGGEESPIPHQDDGSASGPQQPGQIY